VGENLGKTGGKSPANKTPTETLKTRKRGASSRITEHKREVGGNERSGVVGVGGGREPAMTRGEFCGASKKRKK